MSETAVKDRKAATLDEAFVHAFTRYGQRIVSLGEDGDSWLVAGHPGVKYALAVWHANFREDVGCAWAQEYPGEMHYPPKAREIWVTFEPHDEDCDYLTERDRRERAKDDPNTTCPLHDEDCPCNEGEECEAVPLEVYEEDCTCDEYGWWLRLTKQGSGYPVTEVYA